MKNKNIIVITFLCSIFAFSQDELIAKLKDNKSNNAKFQFTIVKDIQRTSVKNQGSSGTCWSYSGSSFLESEMIKAGKQPIDLSEIFTARQSYLDKAQLHVLMDGYVRWGDGGELHDVINMFMKYGAIPQTNYSGLLNGATKNNFNAMQKELKSYLDSLVTNSRKGKISTDWKTIFNKKLDKYLGEVPKEFMYNGKYYNPQSFAKEVVGINPDHYINVTNYSDHALYKEFVFPVPDNWAFEKIWNVKMTDLTDIVDNAINLGYTVAWATDVSEPYFSWNNGVAYVPDIDLDNVTPAMIEEIFSEPKKDKMITEKMRQDALNTLETTDDHGMQIVGLAKDQSGKEYYIVKNSWGESNDYKGYLFVSKPYLQYKTTAILVNKKALPKNIASKIVK